MLLKPEFLIFIYDGPETNSFIVVKKKRFPLMSANSAKYEHCSCSC